MMKETEKILLVPLDFLPLKTNAYIVEGNAHAPIGCVVPKNELNYIMGNAVSMVLHFDGRAKS